LLATGRGRFLTIGAVVVLLIAVGTFGYVLGSRPPAAASGTASLTIFRGSVNLLPIGVQASHPGVTGELLGQGERLTTGPATWAAINFPDGSITRLDANTQLTITTLTLGGGGGWNVQLNQTLGKTWNRVAQLVGGAKFSVTGPNATNAEVRGTDYEVLVLLQPDGSYQVRVNDFSGAVTVFVGGNPTPLGPNQSTSVAKGATSASPPGPIPQSDLNDPFVVFNQTINSQTGGTTATVGLGALTAPNSSGIQPGVAVDGNTDADFALGWPGSSFRIKVYAPDGTLYSEVKSSKPPLHLVVPRGTAGNWTYEVIDDQSGPDEAWVVVINTTTPSTLTPKPFFVVPPPPPDQLPCAHGVGAGKTDTWKVEARDAAGHPVITASGLPAWGTFKDNGDGTGTLTFSPPADTPSQVVHLSFTASLLGVSDQLTECTESVTAVPKSSTIGGTVTGGPGAGVVLTLAPSGATTTTNASGAYGFGGLGAGDYTVTMTVPDGYTASGPTSLGRTVDGNNSAVANFVLLKNVQPAAPTPQSPAVSAGGPMPPATFGGIYTFQFAASGGTAPYTFSKVSGLMPPGLTLSKAGLLVGSVDPNATPLASSKLAASHFTAIGLSQVTYSFGVQATGADGRASTPFTATVVVNPQPTITFTPTVTPLPAPTPTGLVVPPGPTLTGSAPANGFLLQTPAGDMTVPYSQTFGVVGGSAPYTWSISSGPQNPFGLSLSPGGVLSGVPNAPADEGLIQVRVTDATGVFVDGQVDIDIYQSPKYSHPTYPGFPFDPSGFAEIDANMNFGASLNFIQGGAGIVGLSVSPVSPGQMPACMKLSFGDGLQIGRDLSTTCAVGSSTFTIRATDLMGGYGDSIPLTIKINAPIQVSAPPAGAVGANYSWAPLVSGGRAGSAQTDYIIDFYAFQFSGSGLTPNNSGTSTPTVTGTPAVAGDLPVNMTITDNLLNKSVYLSTPIHVAGTPPLTITGGSLTPYVDVSHQYGDLAAAGSHEEQ